MGNPMTDKIDLNEWVVVKTSGGGYLGKVKNIDPKINGTAPKSERQFRNDTYYQIATNGWLELFPCFDFMSPMRPVQDRNTGAVSLVRDPIVTAVDFCTDFVTVSVYPSSIVFLSELSSEDRKTYEGFIRQTTDRMQQARAAASGLVLPNGTIRG